MNHYEIKQEARRERLEARAERLQREANSAFKRADLSEAASIDDRFSNTNPSIPITPKVSSNNMITEVAEEWFDGQGRIFLAWGILNPNGPTLYCLGERRNGESSQIFFRWLHMLGGRTYFYGAQDAAQLTYEGVFQGALAITEYLSANRLPTPFDTIPSFVIASGGDEGFQKIARRLILADAAATKDWGRELAYTKAFGDNFFDRAGCEIRSAYDESMKKKSLSDSEKDYFKFVEIRYGNIPAFKNAIPPSFTSSTLTDKLFDEWWIAINTVAHCRSCLGQLFEMWRGALSMLTDEMSKTSVPLDQVTHFLSAYNFLVPEKK